MPLYEYQKEGAAFLASRQRAMLLDEQGLGKSAQAIEACNVTGANPVLVVCPASVRSAWRNEFDRFGRGQRVTIESFDRVARDWRAFDGPWGAIIIDEAHYLKSPNAKRTQVLYGGKHFPGLVNMAGRVYALTGTPAPNNPMEVHTHMDALAPSSLAMASDPTRRYDRFQFQRRYCVTRTTNFGEKVVGSKNMDDLRARLAPWTLRRLKKDVLPDLPPLTYSELSIDAPEALKAMADIPGDEMALIRDVLKDGDAAALEALSAHLATLRRVTAIAKAPVMIEWLKEFLENTDRKIVVFSYHREPIEMMAGHFQVKRNGTNHAACQIHGSSRSDGRATAIERFQNDPDFRVFFGQIQAAGTGITLTAASDVVFLEQSWVPADNAQAVMRIHRIGQRNGCTARYMTLAGSVDEGVQRALAVKTKMISELFD